MPAERMYGSKKMARRVAEAITGNYRKWPVKRKHAKPEKTAENKFVKEARAADYLARKMNGLGNASWPDQLVIGNGFSLFIEFKREGEDLTPLQEDCHHELKRRGHCVYVARTVAEAWWCVRHAAHHHGVPAKGAK